MFRPECAGAAASALACMGDDDAIGPLIERLKDNSPLVRCSAAYALGARRARAALPALLASVNDAEPAMRRNVVWAIGPPGGGNSVAEVAADVQ